MISSDAKGAGVAFARFHFLLLFPGFFFYQAALGYHLVPPVTGGYFSPIAVVGFPFLLVAYWICAERDLERYTLADLAFGLLVVLTVVISVVNYSTGWNDSTELLVWSLSGLLFNVTCYLLGRTLDLTGKTFRFLIYGSMIVMIAIVLLGASAGSFSLSGRFGSEGVVATYQALARSLVVVGIVAFSMSNRVIAKVSLFMGTIVALFLNGARTELVIYVLAIGIFTSLVAASSAQRVILWLAVSLASVAAIAVYLDEVTANLPQTRMAELFDIWNSSSGMERRHFSDLALAQIAQNPVFGDYGGYLAYGGVGAYSHNLLSAWVNLGVAGFCLYVIALMAVNYGSMRTVLGNRQPGSEWTLACLFALFVTFAMIASKDYSYMLFGMALGFYSKAASLRGQSPAMARNGSFVSANAFPHQHAQFGAKD